MDRPQLTGALIIAGAAVQILLFLVGVTRKSYLAVAIPIGVAIAALSALAIWVGWTMMTAEADLPEPDEEATVT